MEKQRDLLRRNEEIFKEGKISFTVPNLLTLLLVINSSINKRTVINKILQNFNEKYRTLLINYNFQEIEKDILGIPNSVITKKNILLFPVKDISETFIPVSENFYYATLPKEPEKIEEINSTLLFSYLQFAKAKFRIVLVLLPFPYSPLTLPLFRIEGVTLWHFGVKHPFFNIVKKRKYFENEKGIEEEIKKWKI